MSAGDDSASPLAVNRSLDPLAPRFRLAVENALQACADAKLDAKVYETFRSDQLQVHYYAKGRTIPNTTIVTNAPNNLFSWHGYGLAVDVISASKGWAAGEAWFEAVAAVFKQYGLRWGGDWTTRDLPHFQWGPCKPSPSDRARALMASGGARAVWHAVNAD